MKKIISSLVASGMLIASVAPTYASAINISPLNELSVESSVLTEGITVDGNYIPSGATAVTVDISNNTGFDNSKTVLELGEAFDVIEGVDNKPLVTNGSTFDDSLVCAVEIDNVITVVSASADVKENDGSLFTFYVNVNENCEDKEISILDVNENRYESLNLDSNNRTVYYYGDANGDSIIDARDASLVLTVVTNDTNYPNHRLPINYVQNNITSLFPNIPYAKIVDTFTQVTYDAYGNPIWNNNYVSEEDAYDILTYYAISSATESSTVYTGMCGEPFNP